jgi:hypothetical protein
MMLGSYTPSYELSNPKKQEPLTTVYHQTLPALPPQHTSGLTPSTTGTSTLEKKKPSLDLTQRFEQQLAKYNASQNVFKRWLFEIINWLVSASCMGAIICIYVWLDDKPMSQAGVHLTYANLLGKVASALLIVPTSEALGQLKWNWFQQSNAMWDFEIFDKASRYESI